MSDPAALGRSLPLSRSVARTVALAARRATSSLRPLPDFLVIGAQKAGTTSLYDVLTGHPDVLPARTKEVQFFSLDYDRGESWYRAHFPSVAARQRRRITGEATPYYLFHPLAPQRTQALLPRAKLVVLLRDPVVRAHSHFVHSRRLGFEPLTSFRDALDAEAERLAGGSDFWHQHASYVSRGRYALQLRAWLEVYSREQVLVLRSEDFFADTAGTASSVARWLGLSDAGDLQGAASNAAPGGRPDLEPGLADRVRESLAKDARELVELLGPRFSW